MKKRKKLSKFIIYYIIGFVLFTVIAYIVQLTIFAVLTNDVIIPGVEIRLLPYHLFYLLPWYIGVYTILFFLMLYIVHKYDMYIVNKLNKELEKLKGEDKNE